MLRKVRTSTVVPFCFKVTLPSDNDPSLLCRGGINCVVCCSSNSGHNDDFHLLRPSGRDDGLRLRRPFIRLSSGGIISVAGEPSHVNAVAILFSSGRRKHAASSFS